MSCRACASHKEAEFSAEVMIHFTGVNQLDKPGVLVFPRLLVCLECGFSRFTTPKAELTQLARPTPINQRSSREERSCLTSSLDQDLSNA
jgi:hypothetical protein